MSTTARRQRWWRTNARPLAAALALAGAARAAADDATPPLDTTLLADVTLERVTVTAARPATLPTEISTTIESITGKQDERTINATDAEDALKYVPSLSVRKRYIGDYDNTASSTTPTATATPTPASANSSSSISVPGTA